MGWQIRRSKRFGPLRFTATRRGLSTSISLGIIRFTRRADGGWTRTWTIPGLGAYNTKRIGSDRRDQG